MKRIFATAVLVCSLSMPVPAAAATDAFGDMFSFMFRMMLTMMNVMSEAAGDGNNSWGNSLGSFPGSSMTSMPFTSGMGSMGMGTWPMMMSGMSSPFGMSGMSSPFGMSGMSSPFGMSGMSGMNPWSGFSGMPMMTPGMSPWGSGMNMPWQGGGSNPAQMSRYGMPANRQYSAGGYPGQGQTFSLLDGRWFGSSGEMLEIRGNRFRLQDGQSAINGAVRISNNIVNLLSPQTGTVTQYTFVRNQSELVLQDASGQLLVFQLNPGNRGPVRIF